LIVPALRVVAQGLTLRVIVDAERPVVGHSRAERWNDQRPDAALYQAYRIHRICCRFPADRGQARSYTLRVNAAEGRTGGAMNTVAALRAEAGLPPAPRPAAEAEQ
jgi:hypothetical protein